MPVSKLINSFLDVSWRSCNRDFLELRLRLLTPEDKRSRADLVDVSSENQDPDYPHLHFEGATYHYTMEQEGGNAGAEPIRRGRVHGVARPVYATSSGELTGQRRAISAIHMTFTHSYDGEECVRLSCSGDKSTARADAASSLLQTLEARRRSDWPSRVSCRCLRNLDRCKPWSYPGGSST